MQTQLLSANLPKLTTLQSKQPTKRTPSGNLWIQIQFFIFEVQIKVLREKFCIDLGRCMLTQHIYFDYAHRKRPSSSNNLSSH